MLNILENVFIKNNVLVDWIVWFDFDERITNDITKIASAKKTIMSCPPTSDVVIFPLYHMWNNSEYNAEYPYSKEGMQLKKRCFRHVPENMPYIIKVSDMLHFELIPYNGTSTIIPLQIKHIGLISERARQQKYNKYQSYDKKKNTKL